MSRSDFFEISSLMNPISRGTLLLNMMRPTDVFSTS